MHADALECLGDGRERADDLVVARAAHLVQRPGRVLAARPGDQRLRLCHRRRVAPGALAHSRSAASAARSPDSQAPPTVPHSVSCMASPAKNSRSRTGSISTLRPPCPFGAARRECAERERLAVPVRRVRLADRLLHVRAEEVGEPAGREIHHRGLALRGKLAAELAGDFDHAERRAGHVRKQRRGARATWLLENQIVVLRSCSGLPFSSSATWS